MEEKNRYKPTRMELTEKGKIEYILSKPDTTKLEKLTNEDIVEYINVNYIDNYDNDKSGLINDLRVFKTYKDDLEVQNINANIFESFINSLIPILSIYVAVYLGLVNIIKQIDELVKKENVAKYQIIYKKILSDIKLVGCFLIGLLIIKIIIFVFRNIGKIRTFKDLCNLPYSRNNKLVSVSYAIHTLESIKEENYFNPNYSEKKTDKTASEKQVLSDNSNENDIKGQQSNVIFDPDKSLYENIEDARSEDIINFIENYEFYYSDINLENLNEHLLIFRFCKNDLDRDLKNREVLLNYFGVFISVAALIVAIIAVQNKPVNSKLLGYVTLGIVLAYIVVMTFVTYKIFNDDKGGRKVVALQYGIDVLEMKKEKLDAKKKD